MGGAGRDFGPYRGPREVQGIVEGLKWLYTTLRTSGAGGSALAPAEIAQRVESAARVAAMRIADDPQMGSALAAQLVSAVLPRGGMDVMAGVGGPVLGRPGGMRPMHAGDTRYWYPARRGFHKAESLKDFRPTATQAAAGPVGKPRGAKWKPMTQMELPGVAEEIRLPMVQSFNEVKHGEPVRLRAWHATGQGRMETIEKEGFKAGMEVERNPLNPGWHFTARENVLPTDQRHLIGSGVYFSDVKSQTTPYGIPLPVEVAFKKPYVIPYATKRQGQRLDQLDLKAIRLGGYDGIVIQNPPTSRTGGHYGEPFRQGVAFAPERVRLYDPRKEPFDPKEIVKGAKVRVKEGPFAGKTGRVVRGWESGAEIQWDEPVSVQGKNWTTNESYTWMQRRNTVDRTLLELVRPKRKP